ncbi:MAG: glycosyltransferase, partial [Alphaproteobacteria bacterium]
MSAAIAFLVTHLMGSGHLVRIRAIARAAARRGARVVILSGGRPLPHLGAPDVPFVQLPWVMADGLDYRRLLDPDGRPVDAAFRARMLAAAQAALAAFRPDILVTETWPFGRGALRAEYAALAEAARQTGARRVVSLRDIPEPSGRAGKLARAVRDLASFDLVLVHGPQGFHDLLADWPLPPGLRNLLRWTGFVAEPLPPPRPGAEVLVAAGSGVAGRELMRIAAAAARLSPRPWRILVGGSDAARFAAGLPGPARAEPVRADYRARLAGAAASVSLAGYGTVTDLLQCATPAVLVPMTEAGQHEQRLRAAALAAHGFAVADPAALDPAGLAAAVEAAIARGPRPPAGLALDGAAR